MLGTLGIVVLLLAVIAGYTQRALFNSDQFAARAASTLTNEAVQEELALAITDGVVRVQRDLIAARPLIQGATQQLIGGGAFRSLFRASVADVHRSLFDQDAHTVTLTIANLGVVLRTALRQLDPKAADMIATDVPVIDSDPPDAVLDAVQAGEDLRLLTPLLFALAVALLAAAIALFPDRREGIRRIGIGLAAGSVLLLVAYGVAHARIIGTVEDPSLRAALDGVWDAYLLDLRNALLILAGSGAVIAAAAASVIRPVGIEVPLRRTWELVRETPERPWPRALRAVGLIAIGALILSDTMAALRLVATVLAVLLIYAGAQELLRLVTPESKPAPEGSAARSGLRRWLPSPAAAVAGAAAVLFVAGATALFIGTGGTSQAEEAVSGCNGHEELCDRTLPEVALGATHNSFSAADYPNWLFAQHESGIAKQLAGGVHGFLIDTHYGRRAPNGRVATDLGDDENASRQTYVEEFGKEAVDAALAIRDSIGGYDKSYPRDIYMCHRFCELGARLLSTDLKAMRDFLALHPNEVLVVINQNEGVGPKEFARVVEESGLDEFVYRGPTDDWPTLGEMVRDNERVVLMAENPPFDEVPWYHEAYAITKETPYTFNKPAQLIDPDQIPRSCRPNRGPEDAPLFLVNHWIDTSPAPRPSNAAKVNAYEPLLRRARECERIRKHFPNLLAIDFFKTGDLEGVVDELNGVAKEP